jgi:hypothetical protein
MRDRIFALTFSSYTAQTSTYEAILGVYRTKNKTSVDIVSWPRIRNRINLIRSCARHVCRD